MEEKRDTKDNDNSLFVVKKSSVWKISTAVLGILLAITLFTDWFDGSASAPSAPSAPAPAAPTPTVAAVIDMDTLVDDDAAIGDKDAPVVIVEFSDYECPFCGRFFSQTLPEIKKEYIDKGLVKLVYRDFPLSFHPNAQKAAEAAECAGDQGKYFEMHDKIFENQQAIAVANLKAYAVDLGLNTVSFNNCLDSGKYAQEVRDDFADGQRAGITGTPGFIINGELVSGAQPFSAFQQVIDRKLAEQ